MKQMIGIVGGIGSYAGIDLIRKVYDLSEATTDQEHLPVSMLSAPHKVVDRTGFLIGDTSTNPGVAIANIINTLVSNGATVIGIPCNTAHAPKIFDCIKEHVSNECRIVHLIEEVGRFIHNNHVDIKKVGVLGTTGTLLAKIYPILLQQYNIEVIEPSQEIQRMFIQPSIYNEEYGIKAFSNPINKKARSDLITAATYLSRKGAQAIILGCTEIPLAIQTEVIENSLVIDATKILAQALIRESSK